jgi:CHAT domain-containing protein
MSADTLYMEALFENDSLKIGLHKNESVWTYEEKQVSINHIENQCVQIIDMINRAQRQASCIQNDLIHQVKNEGRMLGDALFTPTVKTQLNEASEKNLVLRIDDHLVQIPWELICIRDHFLCYRFNMGREVKTRQTTSHRHERQLQSPRRMWIISDPYDQLSQTIEEGQKICNCMDLLNKKGIIVDAVHQSQIMPHEINERIRNFDMVHFAGHMNYNSDNPDECGWQLSDGIYQASDISRLDGSGTMPAFIFSNACQSARTTSWDTKIAHHLSSGLVGAFMIAGVKHYIGPICEIVDSPGSKFAIYFYESLVQGISIGESVRIARTRLLENNSCDIGWATYILYGNPSFCYFEKNQKFIQNNTAGIGKQETLSINRDIRARWSTPSDKSIRINKVTLIIIILFSLFGLYYYASLEQGPPKEIIATVEKRADLKQERNEKLFNQYMALVGKDLSDPRISSKLSIYTVLDPSKTHLINDQVIPSVIQKKLITANLDINILERESFDHVLTEKIQILKQGGPKTKLFMSRLALIIVVQHYQQRHLLVFRQNKVLVFMRLIDMHNGNILDVMDETYPENLTSTELCRTRFNGLVERLKKIKKLYPMCGIVKQTLSGKIVMNIGEEHGVTIGQIFSDTRNESVFKVISVQSNACGLTLLQGELLQGDTFRICE